MILSFPLQTFIPKGFMSTLASVEVSAEIVSHLLERFSWTKVAMVSDDRDASVCRSFSQFIQLVVRGRKHGAVVSPHINLADFKLEGRPVLVNGVVDYQALTSYLWRNTRSK